MPIARKITPKVITDLGLSAGSEHAFIRLFGEGEINPSLNLIVTLERITIADGNTIEVRVSTSEDFDVSDLEWTLPIGFSINAGTRIGNGNYIFELTCSVTGNTGTNYDLDLKAGNAQYGYQFETVTIVVDNTAPTLTADQADPGITKLREFTVELSGTWSDSYSEVEYLRVWYEEGGAGVVKGRTQATLNADGTWNASITFPKPLASANISAEIADVNGNVTQLLDFKEYLVSGTRATINIVIGTKPNEANWYNSEVPWAVRADSEFTIEYKVWKDSESEPASWTTYLEANILDDTNIQPTVGGDNYSITTTGKWNIKVRAVSSVDPTNAAYDTEKLNIDVDDPTWATPNLGLIQGFGAVKFTWDSENISSFSGDETIILRIATVDDHAQSVVVAELSSDTKQYQHNDLTDGAYYFFVDVRSIAGNTATSLIESGLVQVEDLVPSNLNDELTVKTNEVNAEHYEFTYGLSNRIDRIELITNNVATVVSVEYINENGDWTPVDALFVDGTAETNPITGNFDTVATFRHEFSFDKVDTKGVRIEFLDNTNAGYTTLFNPVESLAAETFVGQTFEVQRGIKFTNELNSQKMAFDDFGLRGWKDIAENPTFLLSHTDAYFRVGYFGYTGKADSYFEFDPDADSGAGLAKIVGRVEADSGVILGDMLIGDNGSIKMTDAASYEALKISTDTTISGSLDSSYTASAGFNLVTSTSGGDDTKTSTFTTTGFVTTRWTEVSVLTVVDDGSGGTPANGTYNIYIEGFDGTNWVEIKSFLGNNVSEEIDFTGTFEVIEYTQLRIRGTLTQTGSGTINVSTDGDALQWKPKSYITTDGFFQKITPDRIISLGSASGAASVALEVEELSNVSSSTRNTGDILRYAGSNTWENRVLKLGLLADTDLQTVFDSASENDVIGYNGSTWTTMALPESNFTSVDKLITVGSGGDAATLNEGLALASEYSSLYKHNGVTIEVRMLSGFQLNEQVFLRNIDLSHVILTSVDAEVTIIRSALTEQAETVHKPAFYLYNSRAPVFDCLFSMDTSDTADWRTGIVLDYDSFACWTFDTGAGFKNSGRENVYCRRGSQVVGQGCNFTNAGRTGIETTEQARGWLRGSDFSGAGRYGLRIDGSSVFDCDSVIANNCALMGFNISRSWVRASRVEAQNNQTGVQAQWGSRVLIGIDGTDSIVTGNANYDLFVDRDSEILGAGYAQYATTNIPVNVRTHESVNRHNCGIIRDHTVMQDNHNTYETISVGTGVNADYATINEALEFITGHNKMYNADEGNSVYSRILLDTGYVMEEQVVVIDEDLSWIRIDSDQTTVTIDRASITRTFDGQKSAFYVRNGSLPTINCSFSMNTTGTADNQNGVYCWGGEVFFADNTGMSNCTGSNVTMRGGRLTARSCTFNGAVNGDGLDLSRATIAYVNNSTCSSNGRHGIQTDRASMTSATGVTASNNGSNGFATFNGGVLESANTTANGNGSGKYGGSKSIYTDENGIYMFNLQFSSTVTVTGGGYEAKNNSGVWFDAIVTDNSASQIFRGRDSNENLIGWIASKDFDGASGGYLNLEGEWGATFSNVVKLESGDFNNHLTFERSGIGNDFLFGISPSITGEGDDELRFFRTDLSKNNRVEIMALVAAGSITQNIPRVGIGTTTPSTTLDVNGSVAMTGTAYYLGDPSTNGSWRINVQSSTLTFQRRESGSYITKGSFTA